MARRPLATAAVSATLLLLCCCGPRTALTAISGQLLLRVDCYHHPSQRSFSGRYCDIFSDCDPRFRLCLTDVPPVRDKCRIARHQAQFWDAPRLGACSGKSAGDNLGPLINFTVATQERRLFLVVTVADKDRMSSADLIDELVLQVVPGVATVPNNGRTAAVAMSPLRVSQRVVTGAHRPLLNISGLLRCAANRYGPLCATECRSSRCDETPTKTAEGTPAGNAALANELEDNNNGVYAIPFLLLLVATVVALVLLLRWRSRRRQTAGRPIQIEHNSPAVRSIPPVIAHSGSQFKNAYQEKDCYEYANHSKANAPIYYGEGSIYYGGYCEVRDSPP